MTREEALVAVREAVVEAGGGGPQSWLAVLETLGLITFEEPEPTSVERQAAEALMSRGYSGRGVKALIEAGFEIRRKA